MNVLEKDINFASPGQNTMNELCPLKTQMLEVLTPNMMVSGDRPLGGNKGS